MPIPPGKLPDVGTTVFTVMSQRAAELGAVNLGQGFPDYPCDPRLGECVAAAMAAGHVQYAPMPGVLALRERIAAAHGPRNGITIDPVTEVTVTLGATEALYSAIQALVGPGDEAIVFDPAYDVYDPAIRLAGAQCVHIPLAPPQFMPDWERVRAALSARTRLVIINTPHNPACSCLARADLDELARLLRGRDCHVLADEVYEHMVFDGAAHASVLAHPELRERSVAVYSFGKNLHATGYRVGYAIAPAVLTAELRKVHQFNTFSIAHPLQAALVEYVSDPRNFGAELAPFFAAKRDRLTALLAGSAWRTIRAAGSFFELVDYSALADLDDVAMANRVIEEAGVATIPLSVFYREPPAGMRMLRLCFAKRDETLAEGARRLRAWVPA
jgi:methionine aminotransferase